jgi:hypothetical protein
VFSDRFLELKILFSKIYLKILLSLEFNFDNILNADLNIKLDTNV